MTAPPTARTPHPWSPATSTSPASRCRHHDPGPGACTPDPLPDPLPDARRPDGLSDSPKRESPQGKEQQLADDMVDNVATVEDLLMISRRVEADPRYRHLRAAMVHDIRAYART